MTQTTSSSSLYERLAGACSGRSYALAGTLFLAGAVGTCGDASSAPEGSAGKPGAGAGAATLATGAATLATGAATPPAGAPASTAALAAGNRQQTPTTRKYMMSHFADSVRVREAIVAGKLAEARAAALAVAGDAWSPRLRADYQPHVQAVRDSARAVQAAASLPGAGAALGKLGEVCASCHLKFGGPGSPVAPVPLNEQADSSMVAHALAADQLWQGLSAPSDESWLRGARALVDAPALDSDVGEVAAAARHLRELAQQGTGAGAGQRGKVFGDVVATCAACHERLGINVAWPPR
jgi:cytochrome c556